MEEIEVPDEPSDGIWETTARIKIITKRKH